MFIRSFCFVIGTFIFCFAFSQNVYAASVLNSISVGDQPISIDITPDGSKLYVVNTKDDSVSVIDTNSETVIKTISMSPGSRPQNAVVSPDGTSVYVTERFTGKVKVIETETDTVVDEIVTLSSVIDDVTFTPDGLYAYIGSDAMSAPIQMTIIDTQSRNVVDSIVTNTVQDKIVFDSDGSNGYIKVADSSNPSGKSTEVYELAGNTYVDDIEDTWVFAVSDSGEYAWGVSVSASSSIDYIDLSNNTILNRTYTDRMVATGIAASDEMEKFYVSHSQSGYVSVYDVNQQKISDQIVVSGNQPVGTILSKDESRLYVVLADTDQVDVIELETNKFPLITQTASPYPPESTEWADQLYADGRADYAGSCGATIRQCGCALASFAMLGQAYGFQSGIDGSEAVPPDIDAWLLAHNGYDAKGNIIWREAIKYFGEQQDGSYYSHLTIDDLHETNRAVIETYLEQDAPVIANTTATNRDGTQFGHFILATDIDDGLIAVNDPLWYNTENLDDDRSRDAWVQDYDNELASGRLFSVVDSPVLVSGSISAYLSSPAEIILQNVDGEKLGYDPREDVGYRDIDEGVFYGEAAVYSEALADSGESPHVTKVIDVGNPSDGMYLFEIIGTEQGAYNLAIHTNDAVGVGKLVEFADEISEDEIHRYVLFYGDQAKEDILVRIERLKELVSWLPKKYQSTFSTQIEEFEADVVEDGVVKLNRLLQRIILSERKFSFKMIAGLIGALKDLRHDHNHGHGNEEDKCDEDNRGKSKRCEGDDEQDDEDDYDDDEDREEGKKKGKKKDGHVWSDDD